MAQETKAQKAAVAEKEATANVDQLTKYGGFDLIEGTIEGAQNLNPERKARKKIFLSEDDKKSERSVLKKTLQIWEDILSSSEDVSEMVTQAGEKSEQAEKMLTKNLGTALEETRRLESSYRSVALFYKNTESDKIKNITILNAEPDQLKDLDNTRFIDAVSEELVANYDRLDLRDNYGLLIIPGYLGSNKVIEKWAKIAYENKVTLVTDFEHLDAPDDVMEMFEAANLTGGDAFRSNVIMTCNWLVGRGKAEAVGEEDDLFVAPAGALGGKIYKTLMSQVTAGKKTRGHQRGRRRAL